MTPAAASRPLRHSARQDALRSSSSRVARQEIAAGGIVWKDGGRAGPLVAFMLDPFGRWTFAKGHVRRARGETLAAAAIRETEEEMGFRGLRLQDWLGTTDIWFRDRFEHKGALVHKFITFYLMQAPHAAVGRPQKSEQIQKIMWVPLRRALTFGGYENTRPIISRAVRIIRRRYETLSNLRAKKH